MAESDLLKMGFGRNGAVVSPWSIPFFCFFSLFNFVSFGKKRGESYPPNPLPVFILVGENCVIIDNLLPFYPPRLH